MRSSNDIPAEEPGAPKGSRGKPRFSLLTIVLVMTLAAAIIGLRQVRVQISDVTRRIEMMQSLTRDLVVEDATKIAAIKKNPLTPHDDLYGLYVPSPSDAAPDGYELCLALEGIHPAKFSYRLPGGTIEPPRQLYPVPIAIAELPPGEHLVNVRLLTARDESESAEISVQLNDAEIFNVSRPYSWSRSSGAEYPSIQDETEQFDPGKQVDIHRMRHYEDKLTASGTSNLHGKGPASGVLLWVRPVEK